MWIIFLFLDLINPVFSFSPAKITGCSASFEQIYHPCSESIDGILEPADNGWAFIHNLPANVEYTLDRPYRLTQIRILSGTERADHKITNFLIEVNVQTLQT